METIHLGGQQVTGIQSCQWQSCCRGLFFLLMCPKKLKQSCFVEYLKYILYTEHEVTLTISWLFLIPKLFFFAKSVWIYMFPCHKKRAYKHVTSGNVLFFAYQSRRIHSSWHPFTSFHLCGAPPSFHHTAAAATFGRANHTLSLQGLGEKHRRC